MKGFPKLLCGLIVFVGLGLTTLEVNGDVFGGDILVIDGFASDPFTGTTTWGGNHTFGATEEFADDNNAAFTISVTSDFDTIPPDKKFAGIITFDFSNFAPARFSLHRIDILDIKGPNSPSPDEGNFINTVQASQGSVGTDGFSIFWNGTGTELDPGVGDPILIIQWTQIPAPGGLALLGLAGLFGPRRRR